MSREKFNTINELREKNRLLVGKSRLSLCGQGDFSGGDNVMRGSMNIKHHSQHLPIDDPEFPFFYDGKENVTGAESSFYRRADKDYEVYAICKKYNELLKGKCNMGLVFLHCKEDDSYIVVERKEVENLSENFGFEYKNDFLDQCEVGEKVPKGTLLYSSTSYDDNMNASIGVNARTMYGVHPMVQDDAIVISESFAKRMVTNSVSVKSIPINEKTVLLNKYGKNTDYQGLPNINDQIIDGILAATRTVRETRMFSDMRDASLRNLNVQSDTVFYCESGTEIVDINVYCNNPNMANNKVSRQLLQYYNDCRWYYSEVYRVCRSIIKSGSQNISSEIRRWMRTAMKYLNTQAKWAFNDNVFSNVIVEILVRNKQELRVGRKIVGGKQYC